jgi:hypothetical protein
MERDSRKRMAVSSSRGCLVAGFKEADALLSSSEERDM